MAESEGEDNNAHTLATSKGKTVELNPLLLDRSRKHTTKDIHEDEPAERPCHDSLPNIPHPDRPWTRGPVSTADFEEMLKLRKTIFNLVIELSKILNRPPSVILAMVDLASALKAPIEPTAWNAFQHYFGEDIGVKRTSSMFIVLDEF